MKFKDYLETYSHFFSKDPKERQKQIASQKILFNKIQRQDQAKHYYANNKQRYHHSCKQ